MSESGSQTIHASCVSLDGKGLLILGASGSGKSTLALQLMGLGADLVSDDRTILTRDGDVIKAEAPKSIKGLIEARGIGVLNAPTVPVTTIAAIIDLDVFEKERLPIGKTMAFFGLVCPLIHKNDSPAFAPALLHYLRFGRQDEV